MNGKVRRLKKEKRADGAAEEKGAETGRRLGVLTVFLREILWGGAGFLFGQAQMLFGTHPLGLSLLCAVSGRHTGSVLAGLLLSCFLGDVRDPVVYVCTYLAAALIRLLSSLLLESPDGYVTLPGRLRRRLAEAAAAETAAETAAEPAEKPAAKEKRWAAPGMTKDAESLPEAPFFTKGFFRRTFGTFRKRMREQMREVFSESVRLRMATGSVCMLIVGLYRLIAGGFRYYDLWAAVFAVLVVPAAVMVYSVAAERRIDSGVLRGISEGALLYSLIYSAAGMTVSVFSVPILLSFFFSVFVCRRRGAAAGVFASLLCGVAYAPLYAPAFLLAALGFLLLRDAKKEGASLLLAIAGMSVWFVYIGGAQTLIAVLPSALLGGAAFTVFEKWQNAEREAVSPAQDTGTRRALESRRYVDSSERFRGISDAFSALSEVFYNLSDRFRRPGTLDLRRICDGAFDRFCKDCPNHTVCWGAEYAETLGGVNGLIAQLHTKGKVSRSPLPEELLHRCVQADGILEQINRDCARLTGEMLRNNRTEIFAMDYEAAADIINDALEEEDGEYRFDAEAEKKIAVYLADAGVHAAGITVYGQRKRRILIRGVELENAKVSAETLRADLSELCGAELGDPVFEVENGISILHLQAKRKISVVGAQNNVSADGGVSGDTVNLFSNKKDYFYALISDGMGCGKEAALTSNLCSVFLEKMLRAGNRAGTSLRMLNNMIRSRGSDSSRECSSTVDLLELDLMRADASFIKSGAAPSFVIRGRVVHQIQSGTIPIGIIGTLDAQKTDFSLRVGDTVVLVSDGILEEDPDCVWLIGFLEGAGELTPDEIVYHICLHAAEEERHDDCSAIALRIGKG